MLPDMTGKYATTVNNTLSTPILLSSIRYRSSKRKRKKQ